MSAGWSAPTNLSSKISQPPTNHMLTILATLVILSPAIAIGIQRRPHPVKPCVICKTEPVQGSAVCGHCWDQLPKWK